MSMRGADHLTASHRPADKPCDAQSPKVSPKRCVHGRGPSRMYAELPSISGLADAGLGLTEGALPGSADAETSSSDAAPLTRAASQNGKLEIREEQQANSHIRVEVTMPPDFLKKAQQKALKQLRADAPDIPGFRKGKKVCSLALTSRSSGLQPTVTSVFLQIFHHHTHLYSVLISAVRTAAAHADPRQGDHRQRRGPKCACWGHCGSCSECCASTGEFYAG